MMIRDSDESKDWVQERKERRTMSPVMSETTCFGREGQEERERERKNRMKEKSGESSFGSSPLFICCCDVHGSGIVMMISIILLI